MSVSTGKLAHMLLASALFAVGGGLAMAAETEPATIEAGTLDGNADAEADKAAKENAATSDDPPESHDVFLPTEEISEDFAVPFPVDI